MRIVIERADGEQRIVGGYKLGAPPPNARAFDPAASGLEALPPKVDLRQWMTKVEDQGATNSCAANATAGAYEYLMKRHQGDGAYDVSRMFMYFNARAAEGGEIADEGAALGLVIAGLQQAGACSEPTWPFEADRVNDEPDATAFEEAAQFLVEDVQQVPTDLDAWRSALAMGSPIIFGLKLFASFDQQRKKGLVPAPTKAESSRATHGGHAMLCVGYSDADRVFIVRNSWGERWGDQGYCYIPYAYVMNQEHNYGDSWTIHRLANMPAAEEGWGDDSSVLEDVTSFLGTLDDESYSNLLDMMGDVRLERRLALLFLRVVGADGDASAEELSYAAEFLAPVLQQLGATVDPGRLLQRALDDVEDDALFDDTVALFGEVLPADVLAAIANQLGDATSADDATDEEIAVHEAIVAAWQLPTE